MDRVKDGSSLHDWKDDDVINWTGEQGKKEQIFKKMKRMVLDM